MLPVPFQPYSRSDGFAVASEVVEPGAFPWLIGFCSRFGRFVNGREDEIP
jgi:hypothetical protein